mgnify:CR=1 FL=1
MIEVIHLDKREAMCCVCGADCPPHCGIPIYEDFVLPNSWEGEWGGMDACRACWTAQQVITTPIPLWTFRARMHLAHAKKEGALMPDWSLSKAIPDALDCPACGQRETHRYSVGYETDTDGESLFRYLTCRRTGQACTCELEDGQLDALHVLAVERYDPALLPFP